ncbi:MAG TPA: type IV pilus twitching motility protein PilT [Pyrinomonadaceae bacterium]|jgi:twitching motility protein PilT
MDKLNEYLQTMLSTCAYELHLEPNKQPFMISAKGATELSGTPIFGTQISMMIFPLIPAQVKQQLPNQAEIEFVHQSSFGSFNFMVRKSPAGFKVTIRPFLNEPASEQNLNNAFGSNAQPAARQNQPRIQSNSPIFASPPVNSPNVEPSKVSFENNPSANESNYDFSVNPLEKTEAENQHQEFSNSFFNNENNEKTENEIPVQLDVTDTFSEAALYEPPAKPEDFLLLEDEYISPADTNSPESGYSFSNDDSLIELQQAQLPQNSIFGREQYAEPAQMIQPLTEVFPTNETDVLPTSASFSENPQAKTRINELFQKMAQIGASDLHLSVSMPPMIRKDGKMQTLPGETILTAESARELLTSIMPAKNREEFAARNDTDFAYEIPNLARFRANIFTDRKGMGGVFRIIPTKILTAEQLGLSQAVMNLCSLSKGLVVVTGPTGSGKSTTLCAMIDHINKTREDHIITIEDPIEFTHENQKCLVNQREVHNHTESFKNALRAALREDPDILLVGEMRDLETISIAIETAETGHLVFGTLHTTTAASTVDRIIDQFPADRQQQIRVMLSESLKGVIAQTLVPKKGGGRVAALEILIVTPAISNLIREGKTFQISSAMQTGRQQGMVTLNDALFDLVHKGAVEPGDAYIKAIDKANFETMLSRGGFKI